MLNLPYVLGVLCGILVGVIALVFLMKWMKKDGSYKCRFDERQELVRGRGFKYGFYTIIVCNMIYALLATAIEKTVIEAGTAMILIVIIGVVVYAVYSIWNEGYLALNENPKRVMIGFGAIAVFNLAISVMNFMHGRIIKDGVVQPEIVNLLCGVMLLLIIAVMMAKKRLVAEEEE